MEKVICAAIKVKFKETDKEVIIPCVRHGYGYSIIHDLGLTNISCEEGFLTKEDRFLTRREALERAIECDQLNACTIWYKRDHGETELYSEDLY